VDRKGHPAPQPTTTTTTTTTERTNRLHCKIPNQAKAAQMSAKLVGAREGKEALQILQRRCRHIQLRGVVLRQRSKQVRNDGPQR
jgi:hypothetical protein